MRCLVVVGSRSDGDQESRVRQEKQEKQEKHIEQEKPEATKAAKFDKQCCGPG
jgi:hypothetical protein